MTTNDSHDPWTQNTSASTTPTPKTDPALNWERDLISKVAMAAVVEQRRARRWGIFFKLLFFAYLLASLILVYMAMNGSSSMSSERHTAVISVDGLIAASTEASASKITTGLRAAFKNSDTAGVILRINSPGGSPVQAGQIYDEIMRLRKAHPDIPVYAVVTDVCASGGYYIAAAAQEIYANKASVVGSIGVRADGFGFVEAMQKLGIERRLYTAGDNKALLDPFAPQKPEDIQHMQGLLDEIHRQFIDAVKTGRGERLGKHRELFSGLVWTGSESVELGLVDGLGSLRYVAEELIGADKLRDYTLRSSWLDRILTRIKLRIGQWLYEESMYKVWLF